MASAAVPWPRFFRICRPTAHAPDGAPTNGERAAGDAPVVRPQGTPQQRVQVTDDDLIQTAKQLVGEFKTSDDCVAGGVAAALISASGHVYTGVCVDTACSLGFCAGLHGVRAECRHQTDRRIGREVGRSAFASNPRDVAEGHGFDGSHRRAHLLRDRSLCRCE